jgi:FkbM family methyltransferase
MRLKLRRRDDDAAPTPAQHPAVERFVTEAKFRVLSTGALLSREVAPAPVALWFPPPPDVGCEYFEWVDVFAAVVDARDSFTMVELGAGYGRWTVDCYQALRIYHGDEITDHHFIAVEAEPTHFLWLQEHVQRNGLASRATLIEGAVAADDGTAEFYVGDAQEWYGQSLARPGESRVDDASVKEVRTMSLPTILSGVEKVDLMTVDIQGAELEVLSAAADSLSIIKRLSIGTHSPEAEIGLRELLTSLRWKKIHDFSQGLNETPWGQIAFADDGLQTWINPSQNSANVAARAPATVPRSDVAAPGRARSDVT